jgi:hypothetical protein
MLMNWVTVSVDFSNAFVQAKLDDPIWMHLPRGFKSNRPGRTCLKLVKSLYGLNIAPKLWYEHLFRGLKAEGFVPSQNEPCLLTRNGMMIVVYVDDAGIAARSEEEIDSFIESMRKQGFELKKEGTFNEFLGIKLERSDDRKTVTLTQKGLIQKILKATNMNDCTPSSVPTSQLPLGTDEDGEPMKENWGYNSIVGMLLYLTTNTRPDLSFAVSQVARFNSKPKQSHANAIKLILRYLKGSADKGLIVTPNDNLDLDCYVDADFAGLFRRERDDNPTAVKSRTGFVITLGGCPLIWKSQLQTEIALSTMEAEYAALSFSMRRLIPIHSLLVEVIDRLKLKKHPNLKIKCTVFEDNNGCLSLANNHQLTSRTKHYLIKWHFFWHWVKMGVIKIVRVDTTEQLADIFTKGIARDLFEKLRKLLLGW